MFASINFKLQCTWEVCITRSVYTVYCRDADQVVDLHETERQGDVDWVRQVANWSNTIVVASQHMTKQSFLVVEWRRRRQRSVQRVLVCVHERRPYVTPHNTQPSLDLTPRLIHVLGSLVSVIPRQDRCIIRSIAFIYIVITSDSV